MRGGPEQAEVTYNFKTRGDAQRRAKESRLADYFTGLQDGGVIDEFQFIGDHITDDGVCALLTFRGTLPRKAEHHLRKRYGGKEEKLF